jgi:ABC-type antimicrobial peptide transport system permease subunit
MAVGGLGAAEILVLLLFFLVIVGVPLAIIALIFFLVKRSKKSNGQVKKCASCGYSIPAAATVCEFCGR